MTAHDHVDARLTPLKCRVTAGDSLIHCGAVSRLLLRRHIVPRDGAGTTVDRDCNRRLGHRPQRTNSTANQPEVVS